MYLVKTLSCLFYRFEKERRRGRLLDVSNIKRGLGKTTILGALAEKEEAIIVCKNMEWTNRLQHEYPNVKFISASYMDKQCIYNKWIWKNASKMKYLLEEGIDPKLIKTLKRDFNVIGGYIGTYNGRYHNKNRYFDALSGGY